MMALLYYVNNITKAVFTLSLLYNIFQLLFIVISALFVVYTIVKKMMDNIARRKERAREYAFFDDAVLDDPLEDLGYTDDYYESV
jgi:hypothetical protein